MRQPLLFLLLAVTGLFAADWTPPGVISIDKSTATLAVNPVRVSSIYQQFAQLYIPANVATVKASPTPIKSTRQVWAHGVIFYFHGFPVASPSASLAIGQNAAVDALYEGDPDYAASFTARFGAGVPLRWIPEFANTYKARWEASYDAVANTIVFTLRIEDFAGADPIPYPAERRDGSLVPLPTNS